MTEIVIYATAGGAIHSRDADYLDANTGSNLTASNAATDSNIGQRLDVGEYDIWEGFLEFDTSPLVGETIQSATLAIWISSLPDNTPNLIMEAYARDWGGGTLTTADWVSGDDLGALTLVAYTVANLASQYIDLQNNGSELTDLLGGNNPLRLLLATLEESEKAPPGAGGRGDGRFFANCGLVGGILAARLTVTVAGGGYPQTRMF